MGFLLGRAMLVIVPLVTIAVRVHAGGVGASHTLNGDFLRCLSLMRAATSRRTAGAERHGVDAGVGYAWTPRQ